MRKNQKSPAQEKSETAIKVTVGSLISEIDPAVTQLGSFPIKNMESLISIAKFRRAVKDEVKLYAELHKQITEESCEKDATGHPVFETITSHRGTQQIYKYKSPADEQKVASRLKQLHEKEIEIKITPIKASDLKNVDGVSANMLEILSGFILFE